MAKQLINLSEEQREWVARVVEASKASDQFPEPTSQTEVIRVLIAQAMVEDPESFVGKIGKWKLKAKLDDVTKREESLKREKEELVAMLGNRGNLVTSR